MVNTVIIDDDYISRMVLREMISKSVKDINLLGEADCIEDGIALIERVDPELVLLDISLTDGSGFDLLDRLKKIDFKVIFITAYSEYAIRAFKYAAFDYIVKPLNLEELTKSLSRIPEIKKIESKSAVKALKENIASGTDNAARTIALPELNGFAIVKVDDIIRCEGKRNYTRIIFKDHEQVVSRTLLEFENLLVPLGFCRIHRSHLVNMVNVVRYHKTQGGLVELKSGELLKVSPKHKGDLLDKLLSNKI